MPPPNREIGYAISNEYTSNGYGTQAARGLIKYLFENTNTEILNATALTYNLASNNVIRKCGFRLIDKIEIEGKEYFYYRLSKSEYIMGEKDEEI
ncbi:hypothetical protein D3C81_1924370 [compost metagenome]